MKSYRRRILLLLSALVIPIFSIAQHIFSEKELDFKKTFLPYDVPYTFALEDKQFIMLSEVKKNTMKLGRYDQYFFEKWEVSLELDIEGSAPQIFVSQDKVCLFSITTDMDNEQIKFSFRYFDIHSGEGVESSNYVINILGREGYEPQVIFSEDKSTCAVYNYLVQKDGVEKAEFQIFNIGERESIKKYYLEPQTVRPSLSSNGVRLP